MGLCLRYDSTPESAPSYCKLTWNATTDNQLKPSVTTPRFGFPAPLSGVTHGHVIKRRERQICRTLGDEKSCKQPSAWIRCRFSSSVMKRNYYAAQKRLEQNSRSFFESHPVVILFLTHVVSLQERGLSFFDCCQWQCLLVNTNQLFCMCYEQRVHAARAHTHTHTHTHIISPWLPLQSHLKLSCNSEWLT